MNGITREQEVAYVVFSEEWVDACAAALRASEDYRRAATKWEWPLLLVLRGGNGGAGERSVYLDLYRGECREARLATPADRAAAPFVLGADADAWREILAGALDPVGGIMRGRITLEKGSMVTLAMHTAAARALVAAAATVDAAFPGDD